jgi:hypothetical protein
MKNVYTQKYSKHGDTRKVCGNVVLDGHYCLTAWWSLPQKPIDLAPHQDIKKNFFIIKMLNIAKSLPIQ